METGPGLKIAVIGGGSSYTPELVEGFINRKDSLPVRELWLVDVEQGRTKLDIVTALAKRMVEKAKVPIAIHSTLNRKAALDGADYVMTQIRVGQLPARINDERIPLRHGMIGQETTGPGGFMKALRTIPVVLDICDDMKALCPEAWLINFANPSGIVTEAALRHKTSRVMGLCNNPINMIAWIANVFKVEPSEVFIEFVGCNHVMWGKRVYVRGRDVTKEAIKDMAGENSLNNKNIPALAWSSELLEAMDGIPCGYIKFFYMHDQMLADCLRNEKEGKPTRGEEVTKVEKALFDQYADPMLSHKPVELSQRGGALYSEVALRLIKSIQTDAHDIHCVSTLNNGALPDLPDNVAVEINCVIDRRGATPIASGRLNPFIRGLVQHVKAFEELTIQAAVTGDRKVALEALTMNPLVPSMAAAKALLDEMLEANRMYLPQFFPNG